MLLLVNSVIKVVERHLPLGRDSRIKLVDRPKQLGAGGQGAWHRMDMLHVRFEILAGKPDEFVDKVAQLRLRNMT